MSQNIKKNSKRRNAIRALRLKSRGDYQETSGLRANPLYTVEIILHEICKIPNKNVSKMSRKNNRADVRCQMLDVSKAEVSKADVRCWVLVRQMLSVWGVDSWWLEA